VTKPIRPLAAVAERRGISATYAVHDRLLRNRDARHRYRDRPTQLGSFQLRLVDDLRRDGYSAVPFGELFPDPALWDDVAAQGRRFIEAAERTVAEGEEAADRKKSFLIRSSRQEAAGDGHPWLSASLSSPLLAVANAYLGMWSKLQYVDLWYSIPQPATAQRAESQLWHRDHNDRQLLKVFLYLVDVDEATGPFEFVAGSQPGGRHEQAWPWWPGPTRRIPDEDLRNRIPAGDVRTFTGEAGTMLFCNTSGLHRGGYATARPRVLATSTYCSPAGLAALCLRTGDLPPDANSAPGDEARFALS
jgi:hypothetical protein